MAIFFKTRKRGKRASESECNEEKRESLSLPLYALVLF